MIITDPLHASLDVDEGLLARHPEAIEGAQRRLREEIIHIGQHSGCFIRPESVWFERGNSDDRLAMVTVHAYWFPDPASGVLFQGGPQDGDTTRMRREADGRPLARLTRPAPMVLPYFDDEARPGVTFHPTYERVGIDSERDMWVYKHVS